MKNKKKLFRFSLGFFRFKKEGNFSSWGKSKKRVWQRNDDDVSPLKDALQRNKNKTGNNKKERKKERRGASVDKVFSSVTRISVESWMCRIKPKFIGRGKA